MTMACPYCGTITEYGYGHLYECPSLNERINTVGKKGQLARPLDSLTHEGAGRPEICNCANCN